MKKIIYPIFICLISLFALTGCLTKKQITTKQFIDIVEKENYQIVDVKKQFEQEDSIKEATIAINEDREYQLEFYKLSSNKAANAMYLKNKEIFDEDTKNENKSTLNKDLFNYSSYQITTKDKFKYLCKVNSTFLYVNVDKKYQSEVEKTIKNLGY